jgi:hypothetical protein
MTCGTRFCGALLLLAPVLAAAQDQTPSPPKQEIVSIRGVGGTFEVKGTSSPNFFEFTQRCESKQGIEESSVLLMLPLDLVADPNDSLERVTTLLRDAAAKSMEVSVESSGEAGKVAFFYWGGAPAFQGVVESLSVKYTLFLPDGTPTRATVSLRMRQANRAMNKGEAKEAAGKPGEKKQSDCSPSRR